LSKSQLLNRGLLLPPQHTFICPFILSACGGSLETMPGASGSAGSTAHRVAVRRLAREYRDIQKTPVDFIDAVPEPRDMLTWHYAISGPPGSPYEGGVYWGRVVFPADYPMAPPAIYMDTPSGRFKTATKLCLSMSDFHPESCESSFVPGPFTFAFPTFLHPMFVALSLLTLFFLLLKKNLRESALERELHSERPVVFYARG
jgi:ubiquitin-protein ligase